MQQMDASNTNFHPDKTIKAHKTKPFKSAFSSTQLQESKQHNRWMQATHIFIQTKPLKYIKRNHLIDCRFRPFTETDEQRIINHAKKRLYLACVKLHIFSRVLAPPPPPPPFHSPFTPAMQVRLYSALHSRFD